MNHCEYSAYKERELSLLITFHYSVSNWSKMMLRADRSPAFNENNTAACNNGTYQY